jgi:hypothetical protein
MATGFALETAWARRRNKRQGYYRQLIKADADGTAATIWETWYFGATVGSGDMVASAAITFTPSATLAGAGALAGASALTFTPSATLAGAGALVGASSISFTPSGTLAGGGALAGTTALVLTPSGTIAGQGALVGSATVTFALAGTADTPPVLTFIEGAASFSFALSGTLRAYQYLTVIIESPGTVTPVSAAPAGTITDIPVPPGQILPLAQAA